jgi:hypothetical protein
VLYCNCSLEVNMSYEIELAVSSGNVKELNKHLQTATKDDVEGALTNIRYQLSVSLPSIYEVEDGAAAAAAAAAEVKAAAAKVAATVVPEVLAAGAEKVAAAERAVVAAGGSTAGERAANGGAADLAAAAAARVTGLEEELAAAKAEAAEVEQIEKLEVKYLL